MYSLVIARYFPACHRRGAPLAHGHRSQCFRVLSQGAKRPVEPPLLGSRWQSYMTVVLDLETGRVLYVAETRKAEALAPFFKKPRRARTRSIGIG